MRPVISNKRHSAAQLQNTIVINTLVIILFGLLFVRQVHVYIVLDFAYVGFSAILILYELRFFLRRLDLFQLFALLSFLMIAGRYLMGWSIGLLFCNNLVLSFFVAHAVGRGRVKPYVGFFLFYLATAFIIYNLLLGTEINDIFLGSKNSISYVLISSFVFLILVNRHYLTSIPILPALITIVLSFWAGGRSGILASYIIMIAVGVVLFQNLKHKKTLQKNLITYGLIIIFAVMLVSFSNQIIQFHEDSTSRLMRKGFASQDRLDMTLAYLEQLTLAKILFGSNLSSIPEIAEQNVNPHSFYIKFHSVFGIVSLVMYMLVAGYIFKRFRKGDVVFGLIVFAFLLRMSTDTGSRGLALFVFIMILSEICTSLRIEKYRMRILRFSHREVQ